MQVAVIVFPGSNCERETIVTLERVGLIAKEFLWNENPEKLVDFAGYVLVGGFSYEDRGRAGIIASRAPIMEVLKKQSELGKPIIGICNGAQILVEGGLVPGLSDYQLGMALTDNFSMQAGKETHFGYFNNWVHMRLADHYQLNAFTRFLNPKKILTVPIAHGEGKFVIPPALLMEMELNGQLLFQYCNQQGQIIDDFPINPNGSIRNLAAVSNKAGNVLAMMPHPERTLTCDDIFLSMRDYIERGTFQQVLPLYYQPRFHPPLAHPRNNSAHELIISLKIIDNQAVSINQALAEANISAKVKRFQHWEIECDSQITFEKIKAAEVLHNAQKENIIDPGILKAQNKTIFLVRSKDNVQGLEKWHWLTHHFNISGIKAIRHGILWQLSSDTDKDNIIQSHLLWNPYAHDYYNY